MNNYPILETVDPLLDILPNYPTFAKKEFPAAGFGVLCYLYNSPETFPGADKDDNWALLREMRGIKYDLHTGRVVSRNFQKFFNHGEKPHECLLTFRESPKLIARKPLNDPAWWDVEFLDKLDGSMISFVWHKSLGHFVPVTKKGFSEVASDCDRWLATECDASKRYIAAVSHEYEQCTLLFEWLNPAKPIVLQHTEPNLVLTAARHNVTGEYLHYELLEQLAHYYNIPLVKKIARVNGADFNRFITIARELQDAEGFVYNVLNHTGRVVQKGKLKATRYSELHRANSGMFTGHLLDAVKLILQDALDDFLPLLTDFNRERMEALADQVNTNLLAFSQKVFDFCEETRSLDQKAFALKVQAEVPTEQRKYYFNLRKCNTLSDLVDGMKLSVLNQLHKESDVPTFHYVLGNQQQ